MQLYEELESRGLLAQVTDAGKVRELLNGSTPIKFYIGFDPTANSLHIGHFVQAMVISHLQRHGHIPVVLFGGGTALIGDPTGKTDMRQMLTREAIEENIAAFRTQMSSMIDFADGKAIQVNNADWLLDLNYVNFLRDVGVHFSVNRMLAAECYKARLERGLSFFEMNYMIMQAYDFLYLNRNYGVTLEMGGDDQWSNMIAGVELTRRADAKEVYAATSGLLLTSEGKKMGKTERGAVWISAARMAPYDFYQYWRNVDDADVISCLKMLTFLPLEQIAEYAKRSGAALNEVKAILAYETTALIHGEAEAEKAKAAAKNLFGGAGTSADAPETSLTEADFDANGQIDICTALVKAGLAKSKSDARRLIEQSSVYADSDKITTIAYTFNAESLRTNPVLLRKGKKGYSRLTADG